MIISKGIISIYHGKVNVNKNLAIKNLGLGNCWKKVMPQVLSGGNYFVNLQRSVRKGDMEIMQRYSVFG